MLSLLCKVRVCLLRSSPGLKASASFNVLLGHFTVFENIYALMKTGHIFCWREAHLFQGTANLNVLLRISPPCSMPPQIYMFCLEKGNIVQGLCKFRCLVEKQAHLLPTFCGDLYCWITLLAFVGPCTGCDLAICGALPSRHCYFVEKKVTFRPLFIFISIYLHIEFFLLTKVAWFKASHYSS